MKHKHLDRNGLESVDSKRKRMEQERLKRKREAINAKLWDLQTKLLKAKKEYMGTCFEITQSEMEQIREILKVVNKEDVSYNELDEMLKKVSDMQGYEWLPNGSSRAYAASMEKTIKKAIANKPQKSEVIVIESGVFKYLNYHNKMTSKHKAVIEQYEEMLKSLQSGYIVLYNKQNQLLIWDSRTQIKLEKPILTMEGYLWQDIRVEEIAVTTTITAHEIEECCINWNLMKVQRAIDYR